MASNLKHAIASKFRDLVPAHKLLFELRSSGAPSNTPILHLNNAPLREHLDAEDFENRLAECHPDATFSRTGAAFPLSKDALFCEALLPLGTAEARFAESANLKRTVLVEYSSPNIAKPFHVGHLRSTIIGQFAANILARRAHVHRLNYLGDWGTQFGYLQLGMQMAADEAKQGATAAAMRRDPIRHLFEAYVRAHRAGETDATVADRARAVFRELEAEAEEGGAADASWAEYRVHTVRELRRTYERLGVEFDEYGWESDYRRGRIGGWLERMRERGVMQPDAETEAMVACLKLGKRSRRVPLIKSDGTTMYLTRDSAAIADRAQRLRFDRMLYVVDNGQADHFGQLFEIARRMEVPGAAEGAEHVKFGRIVGMSTRAGKVVFLKDILDEARDRMWERQRQARTTRVDVSDSAAESGDRQTADILGMSAVIVNDLKQRRQRDYEFDWDKALQMNGDTGVKLQYTHCRLCSLAEACAGLVDSSAQVEANLELLRDPEAEQLLFEMARYADVLARSEDQLEACVLVVYMFGLSNAISRALSMLTVKDHPDAAVRAQRLLMFGRAREILHDGMLIIGLRPLQRM